jgi:hypothetical protein
MDIVERLRSENCMFGYYESPGIQIDAADEIERLRKQNAVLQTELALVRTMLPNVKAYQTGTGDFTPLKDKE